MSSEDEREEEEKDLSNLLSSKINITFKDEINLDEIINKLNPPIKRNLENESSNNPITGNINILTPQEIKYLCIKATEIFMEEPVFLEISSSSITISRRLRVPTRNPRRPSITTSPRSWTRSASTT